MNLKIRIKKSNYQFLKLLFFYIVTLLPSYSQIQTPELKNVSKIENKNESENPKDFSPEFKNIYNNPDQQLSRLTKEEIDQLKQFKIIFIPGYFSNYTIWYTPVGYFQSPLNGLAKIGFKDKEDMERLIIRSQLPSRFNTLQIMKKIKKSPKKVIIIGHSKGGTDFLKSILRHPEIENKIAGFISIQSPFYGSELADYILEKPIQRSLFTFLLSITSGEIKSLEEFSTTKSKKFMEKNKDKIEKLTIPIINFGSFLEEEELMSFGILRPFQNILRYRKIESDGLVPTKNTFIEDQSFIRCGGIDHTDPVVSYGKRTNRQKFIFSLLKVFLNHYGNESLLESMD